jgi:hypothetical protein
VDSPAAVPDTVAENCAAPPATRVTALGEMVTCTGEGVTVTVAMAIEPGSVLSVATTWKVPAVGGAVYVPAPSICPPPGSCTDQLTGAGVPFRVAVKVTVRRTVSAVTPGETTSEPEPSAEPADAPTPPEQPSVARTRTRRS